MKIPSTRSLWVSLGAVGALLAVVSIAMTALLSLQPCHLCIFQRLLFMLVGVLGVTAALLGGLWRRVAGATVALVSLGGFATAVYQSWLQSQPAGTVACLGGELGPIERVVEWLGQQIPTLFMATGFCDDEGLVILGLSLANWAVLCFALMLVSAIWLLRRGIRET